MIVRIEEHLCKEVKMKVKANDLDEAMGYAKTEVCNKYQWGDLVLTADDYTGITLIQTECNGIDSGWKEL